MPLQDRASPRATDKESPLPMIGPMLRCLAVLVTLGVAATACSSPSASSTWSYGPSLAPASPSASAVASVSAAPSAAPSVPASASPGASPTAGATASPGGEATEVTIGTDTGADLRFDPDTATVPTGTRVRLTFENRATLPHNLTFDDPINVATSPIVDPGASEEIEFTAPGPGDYPFVCTLHPGMDGTLTVEPAG
jgi:plastocyanin